VASLFRGIFGWKAKEFKQSQLHAEKISMAGNAIPLMLT
jgi:hypothetical protein